VDAEEARARRQVERVRRRADDEHARGDRPRLGKVDRGWTATRTALKEQYLGDRRGARRSRGVVFPARSEARRARPDRRGHHDDIVAPITRLRAQRAGAAAPRARGHRRSKKITCATAR
jgi:hypothetical protein